MASVTWVINKEESSVHFRIRQYEVSMVNGSFSKIEGMVEADGNSQLRALVLNVQADSVDTFSEERDRHIRSERVCNVAKFPYITFYSTAVKAIGTGGKFEVKGNLSVKDITQLVALDVQLKNRVRVDERLVRMDLEWFGSISRKLFHLTAETRSIGACGALEDEVYLHGRVFVDRMREEKGIVRW
ncbi:MAG TPA: YceI family protein [Puia sp.]|nr:YceI family protein [Puia sp.]